MEEVIKGVYETQFATAYETYKEAVKRIVVLDFKTYRTILITGMIYK